jgi:NADPH2:quinone reductase
MRAIRMSVNGGPEVLSAEDVPAPEPGPGEVRLTVAAAGINFVDVYRRIGRYPVALELPATPGSEAAGVVDAVGPGVTEFAPGDRVATANGKGTYAEQAIARVDATVPVPDAVDLVTAAAVVLQGMTAHYLATSTFPLQPGHVALVTAAAGGTGRLLVQVAKLHGARVIGTVSTKEKEEVARSAGADDVLRYREVDVPSEVARLTDDGVHVVYDSIGAATFDTNLGCLRPRGMFVLYGSASGPVPLFDPQELQRRHSLYLTRPTLFDYTADRAELLERAADVFAWVADGRVEPRIERTWALDEAAEAHRHLESGATTGKLLLIP